MKVAIVSDQLPGYHKIWSGAELIAVTLNDILTRAGASTFFITSAADTGDNRTIKNVFELKTPLKKYEIAIQNFPVDFMAIWGMVRILRDQKPDVVHINGKYLYLPSIIACWLLHIPRVYTVADYFLFCPRVVIRKPDGSKCENYHGPDCALCLGEMKEGGVRNVVSKIPPFILKLFLIGRRVVFNYFNKKVNTYVALSASSKNRLIAYGIAPDNVRIIYHYYIKELQPTHERIEPVSAIFIGWLSVENGINILVDAFTQVLTNIPEAKLYLVGTGKDKFVAGIKKTIKHHKAEDNIVFLGKKENPEALSIMKKCAIVVVPHQWPKEFGPVVLLEAAAMEKPVITSDVGATDEFISEGNSGFLIKDYHQPAAWAEKIKYLLSRPETAREMGAKAKEGVNFLFDNTTANDLMGLYKALTAGHPD